jgi:aminodeoxyfutalosine deaminase
MSLETYIGAMPKVELHVHMEGSIRPETLLKLARRNKVTLPADTLEGLRDWYTFTDFPHFIQVYLAISSCLRTPDDIELIAREFLEGQARQNIRHSEVTYTPSNIYRASHIPFPDQLAAINRARAWAKEALGVTMSLSTDISRESHTEEDTLGVADWAISGLGNGVVSIGLGGPEVGNPPELFKAAFDRARAAGLHCVPHAGETVGPESVWGALRELKAERIGHGVRCVEDQALVKELVERQTPLEVCPTSNVCLKVVSDFASHPFPHLLESGLYVTLNSDDPPMFNTTLTDEYLKVAAGFSFGADQLEKLSLNAVRASFLPKEEKIALEQKFSLEFTHLRKEHLQ